MKKILQNPAFRLAPLIILAAIAYAFLENKSETLKAVIGRSAPKAIFIGKPVQTFTLNPTHTFNRQPFDLTALKGYPFALHFWATWCGPCVEELPELLSQARTLRKEGYSFVAIALDRDWNTVEDFFRRHPQLAEMKDSMILLLDPSNELAQLYGTIGVPETLLINQRFLVDNKFVGPQNWTAVEMRPYWEALRK